MSLLFIIIFLAISMEEFIKTEGSLLQLFRKTLSFLNLENKLDFLADKFVEVLILY